MQLFHLLRHFGLYRYRFTAAYKLSAVCAVIRLYNNVTLSFAHKIANDAL